MNKTKGLTGTSLGKTEEKDKKTEMAFLETSERTNFDSGVGQVDNKNRHREKAKYKLVKQA